MKLSLKIFSIAFLAAAHVIPCLAADDQEDGLRLKVQTLLKANDYQSIKAIIDAEEADYLEHPTSAHVDRMITVGYALAHEDVKSPGYWQFRGIAWKLLLEPLPPMTEPGEPHHVFAQKESILREAMRTTFVDMLSGSKEIDPDTRHDAAMLLLSYVNWISGQIVSANMYKPVAPFNAPEKDQEITKSNLVFNNTQDELRNARAVLQRAFGTYLEYGYHATPHNADEIREVLDAVNIQGDLRAQILSAASQ
jgi:hypothetical protein